VIFLVEALASSPVLTKLDLSDNHLTDKVCVPSCYLSLILHSQGVSYIAKLLKGQIKLIKTVPIEKRLNANFLGSVELGNAPNVSAKVLDDIRQVCSSLFHLMSSHFRH
jgi:hypothetical protein